MDQSKSDFTQGSILKKLSLFMIPVLGALILQAAYGAVDLLVVGRFGTTAGLSAVSTGSQVLNLVTFVVTQFAMGITVLIARYIGEKKEICTVPYNSSFVRNISEAGIASFFLYFKKSDKILDKNAELIKAVENMCKRIEEKLKELKLKT